MVVRSSQDLACWWRQWPRPAGSRLRMGNTGGCLAQQVKSQVADTPRPAEVPCPLFLEPGHQGLD